MLALGAAVVGVFHEMQVPAPGCRGWWWWWADLHIATRP